MFFNREKNKRSSEQAAALACLHSLNLLPADVADEMPRSLIKDLESSNWLLKRKRKNRKSIGTGKTATQLPQVLSLAWISYLACQLDEKLTS